ncbi:MAG: hypothetical protein FJZ58_00280 [Chlamydiae bacterium]|nr:hypothetical protein [Chlamydiota bacterium]
MANYTHFQGKSVPSHLLEARKRGALASAELHGTEISGRKAAFADALRDSSLAGALLSLLFTSFLPLLLFLVGWALWKTARSACLGWARLERLHRLIEEERWEIEHHRAQEKEELVELYKAKGFSDPLLSQVVDVLMADDNRLLQVMLEEELALPLQALEHPLRQASGALFGAFCSLAFLVLCIKFVPWHCLPLLFFLPFLGATLFTTHLERGEVLQALVWNCAIFVLSLGTVYFLSSFFLP